MSTKTDTKPPSMLDDAREFVRSIYGKPQNAPDVMTQDVIAELLLTPFATQKVEQAVRERERQIATELDDGVLHFSDRCPDIVAALEDYIDQLRKEKDNAS